ncbi:hypothetical protein M9H77_15230 [Catharanthus roseus]|uniref:Uncharacterized protein n=1 Tax=Catharanthus roseus TaxID=4058 RepID=A0ACC0AY53_CATRO|nr:hypothetical protein M9H77_15230 [Catharanthus roseus]
MAMEDTSTASTLIFTSGGIDMEIDQSLPQEEANEIQRSGTVLEDELRYQLISLSSIRFEIDTCSDSSFSPDRYSFGSSRVGSPTAVSVTTDGESISYIRSIVEQMIASGDEQECVRVYSKIRKGAVYASFRKLEIPHISIGDTRMLDSDGLDEIVRRWILAARICFGELFVIEKQLFDQIFQEDSSSLGTDIKYTYFVETVNGPARQLFSFAQTVCSSSSRRSSEKLFSILNLYGALSDLLPDIQMIFNSDPMGIEATQTLAKIADVASTILSEFEDALLKEISTFRIPGGSIHHMTRYVMNYMKKMLIFKQTLIELTVSKPVSLEPVISGDLIKNFIRLDAPTEPNQPDQEGGEAILGLHFNWIATVLQFKLEEKSKLYDDDSLAHLFMMNNIYHMVQQIDSNSELKEMIGDAYFRKLIGKFRMEATKYMRSTWARVLSCLRYEGLYVDIDSLSKSAVRRRLKTFNSMFKEVHRRQATSLVPDVQLREELRISISEKLIQAYRCFLKRFAGHLPMNYIKYSPEDLEVAILDFFEGYPVSQHLMWER